MPEVKEITKIVSEEWRQLDDVKKRHFNIPVDIQKKLRADNKLADLDALRDTILKNVKLN